MEQGTQNQAPAANEQAQASANRVASALDGLLPNEEVKNIVGELNPPANEQKSAAQASEQKPAGQGQEGGEEEQGGQEGNQNQQSGEEGQGGEEQGAEKGEQKPAEEEKKGRTGLFNKSKKSDVVIEKPEDILPIVNKKYGQNLKDIKDLPKFFESVDKFRTAAQKAEALEKENLQFKQLWEEELPLEFVEAAKAHLEGKNYKEVLLAGPKLNFSVPLEKQKVEDLVNEYFPGKFTKEDFENMDDVSPALEIAITAAKDKFKDQQKQFNEKGASIRAKAEETLKAQQAAVSGSLQSLTQTFPDLDQKDVSAIQKALEGGPRSVMSFFYDQNGLAKPEAAKALFLAMYGEEELQVAAEVAARQAESRVNEEIVSRGADTKKPVRQAPVQGQKLSKETQSQIQELEEIANQKKSTF
jgi:hypothetical protein